MANVKITDLGAISGALELADLVEVVQDPGGTPASRKATLGELRAGMGLEHVEAGTWTPGFAFATPGTSSVAYTTQAGVYRRIQDLVIVNFNLRCAITHGTGSGNALITGLPFTCLSAAGNAGRSGSVSFLNDDVTWPGGRTVVYPAALAATTTIALIFDGSAQVTQRMGAAVVPAAPDELWIMGTLSYIADA